MRRQRRRTRRRIFPTIGSGLLAASVLGVPSAAPTPAAAAGPEQARAAEHLAAELGRSPSQLELVYERPADEAGEPWAGKFLDAASGEVHAVYVAPDGAVGGPELLDARIGTALAALSPLERKGDAPLRAAIADAATETLPVAIWVEADVGAAEEAVRERHPELTWHGRRPEAGIAAEARAIRAELWEARRGVYAAAVAPIVERVEALGGTVAYQSTSAPIIFADLPLDAVESLAAEPAVLSMGLEQASKETMSSAGPTVAADWTAGSADQGNGIRVAVVEYLNVRNTGDLAGQVVKTYSTTGTPAYGSGSTNHPTWVAGAIASLNGTHRGVAPGADIVSASTGGYKPSLATDRAIIAAADWAVAPSGGDADVVNTSFAQDTAQGAEEGRRYFDSIGWEDGRTVVSSAGNYGTFGNWNVLSPGTGWNVLTVGGVDDRNTAGTGDDRLWYVPGSNGASYRDPAGTPWNANGDFNKPNVSAPAVSVQTANGMIGSGTSASSPIVAGIVAQLMARDATLLTWPEATRALVMAGAHRRTPLPNGSVNADHEGAGTASAVWSNRILARGGGQWGGYVIGSLSKGQQVTRQVQVLAGQRVRVVVAWSSHTSGSSNTGKADALTADLDLRVTAPNGKVVGSYSFDNNYEVVDIVPATSGTLTARVTHDRFDASSEPYAIAWTLAPPFTDVEGPFLGDVMWAYAAGITRGCAPSRFCPDATVTREQMASFLARALRLPAPDRDYFSDDESSIHEGDINRLATAGITVGCDTRRFCPRASVTREQMASFLARALRLPGPSRDYFSDDESSIHEGDINRLATAGITAGCTATRFCPRSPVKREQMVAFLHRALD